MILFLAQQALAFLLGHTVLRRIQIDLIDTLGTWALSYLMGLSLWGILCYLIDIALSPQAASLLTSAVCGLVVIGLSPLKHSWPPLMKFSKKQFWEILSTGSIGVAVLAFLGRLASKVIFYGDAKNILVSPSTNFGDITVHLHLANFFLTNPPLIVPEAPYFAGTPMRYPFFVNYLVALANPWGDLVHNMQLQSFLLLVCVFISLRSLALQLFAAPKPSKQARWLATLTPLFVLSFEPGLEHWLIHQGNLWAERLPNIEVLSLFFGHLLPQRTMLLGFPMALLTFCATHRWCWSSPIQATPKQLAMLGLLSALVFLAYPFSWAWLVLLSLPYLWPFKKSKWTYVMGSGILTVLLAGVFYPTMVGFFSRFFDSALAPHALWVAPKTVLGALKFWFCNLGFVGVLLLGLGFKIHWPLALSSLMAFLLTNSFQFLPWIWDNTKILTLTLTMLGVLYAGFILSQTRDKKMMWIVGLILIWFLDYNRGLWRLRDLARAKPHEVISSTLVQEASQLKAQEDHLLVYPPTHQNPCVLTGCLSYLNYPGHVFAYGLKGWPTREEEAKKTLKEYQAKWLWIRRNQLFQNHLLLHSESPPSP